MGLVEFFPIEIGVDVFGGYVEVDGHEPGEDVTQNTALLHVRRRPQLNRMPEDNQARASRGALMIDPGGNETRQRYLPVGDDILRPRGEPRVQLHPRDGIDGDIQRRQTIEVRGAKRFEGGDHGGIEALRASVEARNLGQNQPPDAATVPLVLISEASKVRGFARIRGSGGARGIHDI